jgi:hypothetical protein
MKRKQGSTIFLRLTIFLIGALILALYIFLVPLVSNQAIDLYPDYLVYPILIVVYLTAIPFYFALHKTLNLLNYIDKNKAFSDLSVSALKNIKHCAITISILYVISLPFLYVIGDKDDAPGIIVIGMVLVFAPIVIATFAAVLQKLLQKAIDIKAYNDLTI